MCGCNLDGAPGEIRTPDPLVRSQVLYPTELRARREPPDCALDLARTSGPPGVGAHPTTILRLARAWPGSRETGQPPPPPRNALRVPVIRLRDRLRNSPTLIGYDC